MLMFSEGGHHDEYFLQRLSKGSSRLIYQAQKQFPNLLLGFALAEATGLFGLVVALIILFAF